MLQDVIDVTEERKTCLNKLTKNFIVAILCKVLVMVTGFAVQREILLAFGSDMNGFTSTITQILAYMSLLEAGLGSASIQALYRPLDRNDWQGVNGILSATRAQYVKTGLMFLGGLACVALCVPLVMSGEIDMVTMGVLTMLIGMNNVISYIFTGKYVVLLQADNRLYIVNYADMFVNVASCVLRVVAIKLTKNIIEVQCLHLATVGLRLFILRLYVRQHYKEVSFHGKRDNGKISKRWNVLIHHISGMIVNHTDMIILSVACPLKVVSVYAVYNYVFSNLVSITTVGFFNASQATFGKMYFREDKRFGALYHLYTTGFVAILSLLMTTALVMVLPFVKLYTSGVTDAEYYDLYVAVLFFINSYMNLIRIPALVLINATGKFKETQNGGLIEAGINIVVSLLLLKPLGIYGLLLGTTISYCYRTLDVIIYAYKQILHQKSRMYFLRMMLNLAFCAGIGYLLMPYATDYATTWGNWFVCALVVVGICGVFFALVNLLLGGKSTYHQLKLFLGKESIK